MAWITENWKCGLKNKNKRCRVLEEKGGWKTKAAEEKIIRGRGRKTKTAEKKITRGTGRKTKIAEKK